MVHDIFLSTSGTAKYEEPSESKTELWGVSRGGGARYSKDCETELVTLSVIVEIMVQGRFLAVQTSIHYPSVPLEIYPSSGDKSSPSASSSELLFSKLNENYSPNKFTILPANHVDAVPRPFSEELGLQHKSCSGKARGAPAWCTLAVAANMHALSLKLLCSFSICRTFPLYFCI